MTQTKLPKINNEIEADKIKLIDQEGILLGEFNTKKALEMAKEQKLDLVEISPNTKPPVCKILDFGKYKYGIKKKIQLNKKRQKTVSLKEIKLRPNIGQNDFNVKLKHVDKFIKEGNKVKLTVWFRGREIVHNKIGFELLDKVIKALEEFSKIEHGPKMEGNHIVLILSPNK